MNRRYNILLFVSVFFEPTDTRKAVKPLECKQLLTYASPNIAELKAMAQYFNPKLNVNTSDEMIALIKISQLFSENIRNLVVTLGPKGVVTVKNLDGLIDARYYPAHIVNNVTSVSGAGDCFAGGYIHGVLLGLEESQCIALGFQASKSALKSRKAVPDTLEINQNIIQVEYRKIEL